MFTSGGCACVLRAWATHGLPLRVLVLRGVLRGPTSVRDDSATERQACACGWPCHCGYMKAVWALVIVSPPSKLCLSFSYVRVFCIVMQHFSKPHGLVVFGGMWECIKFQIRLCVLQKKLEPNVVRSVLKTVCPIREGPGRNFTANSIEIFHPFSPKNCFIFSKFRKMMRKLSLFFVCQIGKHHDNTLSTLESCTHFRSSVKMCSSFSISFEEVATRCVWHGRNRAQCSRVDAHWHCASERERVLRTQDVDPSLSIVSFDLDSISSTTPFEWVVVKLTMSCSPTANSWLVTKD